MSNERLLTAEEIKKFTNFQILTGVARKGTLLTPGSFFINVIPLLEAQDAKNRDKDFQAGQEKALEMLSTGVPPVDLKELLSWFKSQNITPNDALGILEMLKMAIWKMKVKTENGNVTRYC